MLKMTVRLIFSAMKVFRIDITKNNMIAKARNMPNKENTRIHRKRFEAAQRVHKDVKKREA